MSGQVNAKDALRLLPDDYTRVETEVIPESSLTEEELDALREQNAENDAIRFQAETEGVPVITQGKTLARKVILRTAYENAPDAHKEGRMFSIADRVGLLPLAEFAFHANSGMDTGDMGALAAIYEMLKDCIEPKEWDKFRAYAKEIKADVEDLMDVVNQTTELLTARPTERQSVSSRPLPSTSDSLTDNSSGQAGELIRVADLGKVASMR